MTAPNDRILHTTRSLCPVCLARIEARYRETPQGVALEKECPEHGFFSLPVWPDTASFHAWRGRMGPAQQPVNPANPADRGCPYDCGLCQHHRQATCCVLLEVTARCDLGCPVCFASSGSRGSDPSVADIAGWYDMLLERGGPFNIQLSGGEPSLRDDLPEIIALGREKGFGFFQLNTNGLRIARQPDFLHRLAAAGLNTVFLQFDTLDPAHCATLRGRDIIAEKKRAIANCAAEALGVVLVPTVMKGCNDGDLGDVLRFAAAQMPTVRGVHLQPLSYFGRYGEPPGPGARVTIPALLAAMEAQTAGAVKAADFMPGGAEHPLCSFHAGYRLENGAWRLEESGGSACRRRSSCCSSDTAREAVAQKWTGAPPPPAPALAGYGGIQVQALDDFLAKKRAGALAISGMAFMDAWTVDLERLERCYIHVVSREGKLTPFCGYNLTARDGRGLYRG